MKTKTRKIYGSGGALDLFFRLRTGDADLSGIYLIDQIADINKSHPRFLRLLNSKIQNQLRDYEVQDKDSGGTEIITTYPEQIRTEARDWLIEGYENEEGQEYGDVRWTDLITGDWDSSKCIIGTEEGPPECEGSNEHEWGSPHSVVGGLRENPGVWGIGGTETKTVEVCCHCGAYRIWYSASTAGQYPKHPAYYEYKAPDDVSLAYVEANRETEDKEED